MTKKLFIISRSDLPAGQQLAQSCHAVVQFEREHHDTYLDWHQESNTLVGLTAEDEQALGVIYERAMTQGIPTAAFREPDRGGELTAIALGPEGHRLARRLPLAFRAAS